MVSRPDGRFPDDADAARRLDILVRHNFGGFKGLLRLVLTNVDYLLGTAVKFTRPELSRVNRLVFVCLANLNRSAFAQAVAEQAGMKAASFGLSTIEGSTVPSLALRIATEMGCPIRDHRATHLSACDPLEGDLYLVMELRHAYYLLRQGFPPERIALLGHWSRPRRLHIHDPHGTPEDYLRSCFTLIGSAVLNLGRELQERGLTAHAGASLQISKAKA